MRQLFSLSRNSSSPEYSEKLSAELEKMSDLRLDNSIETAYKMETIKVMQIRSSIRCPKDQKAALHALGITKMNRVKELPKTDAVMGNVRKVHHLISIVEG